MDRGIHAGETDSEDVSVLLRNWSEGDTSALKRLTGIVYGELRRLANYYMGGERAGHSLQTTALVNEAYMRPGGLQANEMAEPGALLRGLGAINEAHPGGPRAQP